MFLADVSFQVAKYPVNLLLLSECKFTNKSQDNKFGLRVNKFNTCDKTNLFD